MPTINFTVEGHNILVDNLTELAQESNNFDTCAFTFDSSWDGFTLYAVMYQDPKNVFKKRLDNENKCKIPAEKLKKSGWLYIGARGEKADQTIATTVMFKIMVRNGAVDGTENGQEVLNESQYEELLGEINKLKSDISQISDDMKNLTSAERSTLIAVVNAIGAFNVNNGQELIDNFNTAWGNVAEDIPATGITLSVASLSFTTGTSQTLIATVEPLNSTDTVIWSSSNPAVAIVSNGVVTPVSNGSCTITAKAGSYSAICEVNVAVESEIVTYTITNNLTNVSTDNPVTTITENSGYTANLTADTDYSIDAVTVTMGGVDVTSDVYTNGNIVISAVTGNVVITASAVQKESGEVVFLDYVELNGGAYFDTGITANMEYKYLIGVMTPDITEKQYIWGTKARNQSNLDTSDYYDDVMIINNTLGADRNVKGTEHKFGMYDSTSMQGMNGSDNKSNLVPWYLYTKFDANALEAYADEDMTRPLGATEFIKTSMTSNYFPYALNYNVYGTEITLDTEKHAPSNVYIGKVNNTAGTFNDYATPVDGMRYYIYKVWDNEDNLLMHLKPAMKGQKIGMYDMVSLTFFESEEGTVTAGNEVTA